MATKPLRPTATPRSAPSTRARADAEPAGSGEPAAARPVAAAQLRLMEVRPHPWQIDERTREIGRRGLQQAREALRLARAEPAA